MPFKQCLGQSGGWNFLIGSFQDAEPGGRPFYPNEPNDDQRWINGYHAIIEEDGVLEFKMVHVHDGTGHATAEAFEVENRFGWAKLDAGVVKNIAGEHPKYDGLD